jgi:hypothetical protein
MSNLWKYSENAHNSDFLEFYTFGKSFSSLVPAELSSRFSVICTKMKAYSLAAKSTKLEYKSLSEVLPKRLLEEYMDIYNQTCESIARLHPRPKHYDLILNYKRLLLDISRNPILFNGVPGILKYKLFGTKTGRTALERDSFPILGLPKKNRHLLVPKNGCFLELDYNAVELRILIALLGREQPSEDVHLVHAQKLGMGREESKKEFFSWLYNSAARNQLFDELYPRDSVLKHYQNGKVRSPLGFEIESDDFHALNYTIQSHCGFLLMETAVRVFQFLQGKKSRISFLVYDSLVIDLEEQDLVPELVKLFSETSLGVFLVNVKMGKDYGSLNTCTF